MSEEQRSQSNIVDELTKLGKQVATAIELAWQSEERKKLEAEIMQGLQKLSDEISEAARKAGESVSAQQIKTQAEKVVAEVKEADAIEELRKGLISGLEVINRELGRLVERLEPKKSTEAPTAEAQPAPEASPATGETAES